MWRNTRMVVLTAICAALYGAILIPFKVAPIIPGVTELRPANALPVVCSFLFGPAGAWGAAFGNLIGDFFGGLGPGDLFGFVGNLAFGLVPYAVWEARDRRAARADAGASAGGRCSSPWSCSPACCARRSSVGGSAVLGFHPFTVVGSSVLVNNLVAGIGLAPLLLRRPLPAHRERASPLPRPARRPAAPVRCGRRAVGARAASSPAPSAASPPASSSRAHRWVPPWVAAGDGDRAAGSSGSACCRSSALAVLGSRAAVTPARSDGAGSQLHLCRRDDARARPASTATCRRARSRSSWAPPARGRRRSRAASRNIVPCFLAGEVHGRRAARGRVDRRAAASASWPA